MAERIKLVQGDTKPVLIVTLTDEITGVALGLNGATVRMYFRAQGDTVVLTTLVANLLPGQVLPNGQISFDAPFNVPGAGGRLQFAWALGDLNQLEGNYEGEIEITFPDATQQTVYDVLKFKLREDF